MRKIGRTFNFDGTFYGNLKICWEDVLEFLLVVKSFEIVEFVLKN